MGVGRERVGVEVGVKNPIADWARVLNYDCLIAVRQVCGCMICVPR